MKKILKNQDGIALSFVVMTLLVLFILTSIVASIAQTNIKQASAQDKGLQAYYTARSGAEMAFEALWSEQGGQKLIDSLKSGTTYSRQKVTSLPEDMGTAEVEIKYSRDNAKKEELITIDSIGTYHGISRNVKLYVYFDIDSYDLPKEIVWSK